MASLPILEPKTNNQDLRLIEAARNGSASSINALINEGVNVNDADANGITPLIMASSAGNLDAVKVLIEHDVKKDHIDSLGYNAYKAAMFYGDFRGVTKEPFDKIMELVKTNENC